LHREGTPGQRQRDDEAAALHAAIAEGADLSAMCFDQRTHCRQPDAPADAIEAQRLCVGCEVPLGSVNGVVGLRSTPRSALSARGQGRSERFLGPQPTTTIAPASAMAQPARRMSKWEPSIGNRILLVIPILMLLGVIPTWPHSRSWGYGPADESGLVLIIVIVLLLGQSKPVQIPRACRNAGKVTGGRNWMLRGRAG